MLLDWLRNDAVISKYICKQCSENGIELIIDQEIDPNNLLIIKIDDYYNNEIRRNCHCSPDCLVIQKCTNHYDIYIVELRNIKDAQGFTVKEIEEKFITCLDNFMSERFGNYFHHVDININILKLFFISDPYHFKKNPFKQLYMKGHKLDVLNSIRIPKFFNKHLYIEPRLPNPTVRLCA